MCLSPRPIGFVHKTMLREQIEDLPGCGIALGQGSILERDELGEPTIAPGDLFDAAVEVLEVGFRDRGAYEERGQCPVDSDDACVVAGIAEVVPEALVLR